MEPHQKTLERHRSFPNIEVWERGKNHNLPPRLLEIEKQKSSWTQVVFPQQRSIEMVEWGHLQYNLDPSQHSSPIVRCGVLLISYASFLFDMNILSAYIFFASSIQVHLYIYKFDSKACLGQSVPMMPTKFIVLLNENGKQPNPLRENDFIT